MAGEKPEKSGVVPKVIYSLWLQGLDEAPEIVRAGLARWAALNPEYRLRVLDKHDVSGILADTGIDPEHLSPQALSDVLRARILLAQGGVWVDASVFPVRPLKDWLPKFVRGSGFFAFDRPALDRPLSSWFMAATPNHPILDKWWREIVRYWSKPRTLARYQAPSIPDPGQIPADPVWVVSPEGGATAGTYPYFWFHYLFFYLLETDDAFAAEWARCTKRSATPAHRMLHLFGLDGRPSPAQIAEAMGAAPLHKLTWRRDYPVELFEAICTAILSPSGSERAA